jgi:broad specificity phosphatase PhoE
MTTRLTLVAAATGPTNREVRFGDDGPLDARTVSQITAAAARLPVAGRCLVAPSRRCRQTAGALGLRAEEDSGLHDLDIGAWRGRSLAEVAAAEPEALAAWMYDQSAAPPGGETVEQLCGRIGEWLAGLAAGAGAGHGAGQVVAVAEPAVVRAAIVQALGCPVSVYRHIDVPPLAVAQLTEHGGRWNLRLGSL